MGAEGVATGHYVRIDHESSPGPSLLRGKDGDKDQAYFLWGLPRETLPFLRFPLGELTKEQVRELARARGLVTADKPESQEICFVPTGDYRDLLRSRLDPAHPAFIPGPFVTMEGERVGEHQGYAGFTIGQRKGLPGGFPEAMFVVEIRPDTGEVVVGPRGRMWAREVELDHLNWLGERPSTGEDLEVQLRHRAKPTRARVRASDHEGLTLHLTEPQFAVTPGQSGVLFRGDRLLGGGRILRGGRAQIST
jgi:tRNA-specific 2-thiouridylase